LFLYLLPLNIFLLLLEVTPAVATSMLYLLLLLFLYLLHINILLLLLEMALAVVTFMLTRADAVVMYLLRLHLLLLLDVPLAISESFYTLMLLLFP